MQMIRKYTFAKQRLHVGRVAACKCALLLQCRRQLRGNSGDQGDHLPPRAGRMETARDLQVFLRNRRGIFSFRRANVRS